MEILRLVLTVFCLVLFATGFVLLSRFLIDKTGDKIFFRLLKKQREKSKKSSNDDPLWDLKKEILKVFTNGPMGFSELCVTTDSSCGKVARALKEMEVKDVVGKRKPIEDSPDFQMWGIARPDFSKLWAKLRKFFSKRRAR